MRKLIATTAAGLFVVATAAAETKLVMNVPFEGKTEINILVAKDNMAQLVLENGSISVLHSNGNKQSIQTEVEKEDLLGGQWGLHFDDFNMDGYQDFAVDVSYGYGGVNVFSEIYAFDAKTDQFSNILEESNIEARPETKELFTGQKSGPRHYMSLYRFNNGKPYKFKDVTSIMNDLEQVTLYNQSGDITKKAIIDAAIDDIGLQKMVPAIRKIAAERTALFSTPKDTSKTSAYLIKGDEVEILDISGNWDEWFKVRYKGKKAIERWVKSDDVDLKE